MAAVPPHTPWVHGCPKICAQTGTLIHPITIDVTSLCVISQDTLFIPWEKGLKASSPLAWGRAGESRRGWERDEALGGPAAATCGWARALPGLYRKPGCSESICRFQTSLCLPRPE